MKREWEGLRACECRERRTDTYLENRSHWRASREIPNKQKAVGYSYYSFLFTRTSIFSKTIIGSGVPFYSVWTVRILKWLLLTIKKTWQCYFRISYLTHIICPAIPNIWTLPPSVCLCSHWYILHLWWLGQAWIPLKTPRLLHDMYI